MTITPIEILLIDDTAIHQKLMSTILRKSGYNVETAGSGIEAIEILKKKMFHLVFVDINMPEMDGIETAKAIRTFNNNIPIVALTGSDTQQSKTACLNAGMNDFLEKPVKREIIIKCIEKNTCNISRHNV